MATLRCRKCKKAEETAGPVLFDNLATRSPEMGEERVGRRTLHEWLQGSLKAWDFTVGYVKILNEGVQYATNS